MWYTGKSCQKHWYIIQHCGCRLLVNAHVWDCAEEGAWSEDVASISPLLLEFSESLSLLRIPSFQRMARMAGSLCASMILIVNKGGSWQIAGIFSSKHKQGDREAQPSTFRPHTRRDGPPPSVLPQPHRAASPPPSDRERPFPSKLAKP
jgi:hypothetical protein